MYDCPEALDGQNEWVRGVKKTLNQDRTIFFFFKANPDHLTKPGLGTDHMSSYAGGLEGAGSFKAGKRWGWVEGGVHRWWLTSWMRCWEPGKVLPWASQDSGLDLLAQLPIRCSPIRCCYSSLGLRVGGCWGQLCCSVGCVLLPRRSVCSAKVDQVPWSDITRCLLSEADFNLPSGCPACWGRSNLVSNWELISADLTRARRGQFLIALKAIWAFTCWKPPGCSPF